jgi:hypothetical protein
VTRTLVTTLLSLALVACADGTLPAHSAGDPRDSRAPETPFWGARSVEPPSPPPPLQAPPAEAPDAGHRHVHEGATDRPDRSGKRTVGTLTADESPS